MNLSLASDSCAEDMTMSMSLYTMCTTVLDSGVNYVGLMSRVGQLLRKIYPLERDLAFGLQRYKALESWYKFA